MYVKLFSSIYQGTLRGNSHGLLVFTNLLAHADQEGFVDIHPRAISEEVGLSVEQVRNALLMLEETDPESRTMELDGRRIVRMDEHRDWGWQIVNYIKYKKIRSEEDRREQNREAQKRFREKNKLAQQPSAESNQSKPRKPRSAHTDADADADTKKDKARASRKPPADFAISTEMQDWASKEVPGLNVVYETKKFVDWTFKTARTDWPATWRAWMRKAFEGLPGVQATTAPSGDMAWLKHTPFDNVYEAHNAGCFPHNYAKFPKEHA